MCAIELIRMLEDNELIVADLYTCYSQEFPDFAYFWAELAAEEKAHARWITGFCQGFEKDALPFDAGRFSKLALEAFKAKVINAIDKAKNQDVSLKEALTVALDIEDSWVEKKFFEVVADKSGPIDELLIKLGHATQQHREKIRKALQEQDPSLDD